MTARKPYARMTADDVRGLAGIIHDVYTQMGWEAYRKSKRVSILLNIFAGLTQAEGEPFPTATIDYPALAEAAGTKVSFTYDYALWLLEQGYLVDVGNRRGDVVAFRWHVRQAERPAGGGEHADA